MEYIWICGACASGKTTLIEKLLQPENTALRRRFRLTGSRLQACSLRYDPNEPPENYAQAEADHVLIHWRYDIFPRILELWHERRDCKHRVIVLWRPLDQVRRDLSRRTGKQVNSAKRVAMEWALVKRLLKRIDPEIIDVEIVDGSQPDYPALPAWP